MSPRPTGGDDTGSGEGTAPRASGARPVVTGTAAARYNTPRPENGRGGAPTENERTQLIPTVGEGAGSGDAGSSGSSGSGSTSSSAGGAGADQPPWQRGRGTAVVDAPTSSIKRSQVPTDMPDLSAPRGERTPSPTPARSGGTSSTDASRSSSSRSESSRSEPSRPGSGRSSRKGPRRASLQLKHVDPWSTLKLSLVLSVAMFLVWMVAVGVLYLVLDTMGVWDRLNSTFSEFVSSSDPGSTAAPLIGPGRIFGVAAIIGAVNVVLLTALATIGSFIYNLSADLAGGVEVTLTERD